MEGQHQLRRPEGVEILQQQHCQQRPGLGDVEGRGAQAVAVGHELARHAPLAEEAVVTGERQPAHREGPDRVRDAGRKGGGPDFDGIAQFLGGPGHFGRIDRDAPAMGVKFMGHQNQVPAGGTAGSGWLHLPGINGGNPSLDCQSD